MPRPYSFDHFQAKNPMQAAGERLGSDEDKQKLVQSELKQAMPESTTAPARTRVKSTTGWPTRRR